MDRFPALDSAPNLHLDVCRTKDGLNLGRVVATSRHGIQINDMQMTESVLSPSDSYPDGIGDADYLLVV